MARKRRFWLVLALFSIICSVGLIFPNSVETNITDSNINFADVAWLLTASGLVLLMTPGLSFFYGGMVSKKNIISTMLQSIICMVIITVMWGIFGFSLAFGNSIF